MSTSFDAAKDKVLGTVGTERRDIYEKELKEYTKENIKSEELMEDFDILIQAWLKSDNENTTYLAWSLSNYAVEKLNIEPTAGQVK